MTKSDTCVSVLFYAWVTNVLVNPIRRKFSSLHPGPFSTLFAPRNALSHLTPHHQQMVDKLETTLCERGSALGNSGCSYPIYHSPNTKYLVKPGFRDHIIELLQSTVSLRMWGLTVCFDTQTDKITRVPCGILWPLIFSLISSSTAFRLDNSGSLTFEVKVRSGDISGELFLNSHRLICSMKYECKQVRVVRQKCSGMVRYGVLMCSNSRSTSQSLFFAIDKQGSSKWIGP